MHQLARTLDILQSYGSRMLFEATQCSTPFNRSKACNRKSRGRKKGIEWPSVVSYARCICDLHSCRRAPPRPWLSNGTKTDFRVTENSWQERRFSLPLRPPSALFPPHAPCLTPFAFSTSARWQRPRNPHRWSDSSTFRRLQLIPIRFSFRPFRCMLFLSESTHPASIFHFALELRLPCQWKSFFAPLWSASDRATKDVGDEKRKNGPSLDVTNVL